MLEACAPNDLILSGSECKAHLLGEASNTKACNPDIHPKENSERCDLLDLQLEYLRNYVFSHGIFLHG